MSRPDGRRAAQLRPFRLQRRVVRGVPGSILVQTGHTHVLCTACVETGVPAWRAGQGAGWVTAEYDMLPASTTQRRPRNRGKIDGRTQEIQRLIGRCMRAVVNPAALGERTIWIDADVLQADGGTRTAAITGSYVALADAIAWLGSPAGRAAAGSRGADLPPVDPRRALTGQVAAVSVGKVDGRIVLDLCYEEDRRAAVDFNVAMTSGGGLVECQGTAEGAVFSLAEMNKMVGLAARGIRELLAMQRRALARRK
ncbi:MAG: ribonuclease PH [Phycisphaerae bacterium]